MRKNIILSCGERLEDRSMLTADVVVLGTLGVPESIDVVSEGIATTAILADINRDGIDDIVYGSGHRRAELDDRQSSLGIVLAESESEFGFEKSAEQLVHDDVMTLIATDLNQDGFLDIVAGGIYRLSVLLSETNDAGEWMGLAQPTYLGGASEIIVVEDFDGDGNLDIAAAATFQWLENPNPIEDPPHSTFANRDVVHTHIYAGNGTGEFAEGLRFRGSMFLVPTDYDSDGDMDFHTFLLDAEHNVDEVTDFFTFVQLGRREYSHGVLINDSEEGDISFRHVFLDEPFPYPEFQPNYVDINGDEYLDLIGTQSSYDFGNTVRAGTSWYTLGEADGELGRAVNLLPWDIGNSRVRGLPVTLPSQPEPFFIDVDGNNANDFVHLRGVSLTIMKQGLLEGFATEALNYPSEADPSEGSLFFDVNGDELIDFVFEGYVYEKRPDGTFGPRYSITSDRGDLEEPIVLVDSLDVRAYQMSGGVNVVLESRPSPETDDPVWVEKFQILVPSNASVFPSMNPGYRLGFQVDVDDDGDLDVVVRHDGGVTIVFAIGEGDFDRDGKVTEKDFGLLRDSRGDEQSNAATLAAMDFDDDGQITVDDEQHWIANIAKTSEGDLNLDGIVDFHDFLVISANYGLETNSLSDGDVDGDGIVGDLDFEILRANFGL